MRCPSSPCDNRQSGRSDQDADESAAAMEAPLSALRRDTLEGVFSMLTQDLERIPGAAKKKSSP